MTKQYELTFIIDAHLNNEEIEAVIQKYVTILEKSGGKVKDIDRWGKRRLAYEIAKKQYGYYVYIRFEADGSVIAEIERQFKLDDAVIRYLTICLPKIALKQEKNQKSLSKQKASETEQSKPVRKESEDTEAGSEPSPADDSDGQKADDNKNDAEDEVSEEDK